jgi:hypothetical protein
VSRSASSSDKLIPGGTRTSRRAVAVCRDLADEGAARERARVGGQPQRLGIVRRQAPQPGGCGGTGAVETVESDQGVGQPGRRRGPFAGPRRVPALRRRHDLVPGHALLGEGEALHAGPFTADQGIAEHLLGARRQQVRGAVVAEDALVGDRREGQPPGPGVRVRGEQPEGQRHSRHSPDHVAHAEAVEASVALREFVPGDRPERLVTRLHRVQMAVEYEVSTRVAAHAPRPRRWASGGPRRRTPAPGRTRGDSRRRPRRRPWCPPAG